MTTSGEGRAAGAKKDQQSRQRKRKAFGKRASSYDPRVGSLVRNERRVPRNVSVPDGTTATNNPQAPGDADKGGRKGITGITGGEGGEGSKSKAREGIARLVADAKHAKTPGNAGRGGVIGRGGGGNTGLSSLSPATAKKYRPAGARTVGARDRSAGEAPMAAEDEERGRGRGSRKQGASRGKGRGSGGGGAGPSSASSSASSSTSSVGSTARATADMGGIYSDEESKLSSALLSEHGDSVSRGEMGADGVAGRARGREGRRGIGRRGAARGAGRRTSGGGGATAAAPGGGGEGYRSDSSSSEDTSPGLSDGEEGGVEFGGGGEGDPDLDDGDDSAGEGGGGKEGSAKRPGVPSGKGRGGKTSANASDGNDTAGRSGGAASSRRGEVSNSGKARGSAGDFDIYHDEEGGDDLQPSSEVSYGGRTVEELKEEKDTHARGGRKSRPRDGLESTETQRQRATTASRKGRTSSKKGGEGAIQGRRRRTGARGGAESTRTKPTHDGLARRTSEKKRRLSDISEGGDGEEGQEGDACQFRGLTNAGTIREYAARRRREKAATQLMQHEEEEERSSDGSEASADARSRSRSRSMSRSRASSKPSFDLSAMEVEERPQRPKGKRSSRLPTFEGVFARAKTEDKAASPRANRLGRGDLETSADVDGFTFVDTLGSAEKPKKERRVLGDRSNTAGRGQEGDGRAASKGAALGGLRGSKSSRKRRKLSHPTSALSKSSVESGTATATNAVQFFVPAFDQDEGGAYQDRKHFGLIEGMGGGVEEVEKGGALPHRGRIVELPGSVMPGKWEALVLDDDASPADASANGGALSALRISLRHNHAPSTPLEDFYASRKAHPNGNVVSLFDPSINRVLSFVKQGVFRDEEEEYCDEEEEKVLNDSYHIGCVSIAAFGGFTSSSVGVIEGKDASEAMLAGCRPPSRIGAETRRDQLLKMYGEQRDVAGVLIPCKLGFDADYSFLMSHDNQFRVTAIDVLFRKPRARRSSSTQSLGLTKSLLSEHQRRVGSNVGLSMERWLRRNAPRYAGGGKLGPVQESAVGEGNGGDADRADGVPASARDGEAVQRDDAPSIDEQEEEAAKLQDQLPSEAEVEASAPGEVGAEPVDTTADQHATMKDAGDKGRDGMLEDVSFAASGGDRFGDETKNKLEDEEPVEDKANEDALETSPADEPSLVDAYGDFEKSRKSTQLELPRAESKPKDTKNDGRRSAKTAQQRKRRSIVLDDDSIEPLVKSRRGSDARRRQSGADITQKRDTTKRGSRLSLSRSTASPSEVITTRRLKGQKSEPPLRKKASIAKSGRRASDSFDQRGAAKKRTRETVGSAPSTSRKKPRKVGIAGLFEETVIKLEPAKEKAGEAKRTSLSRDRRKSGASDKSSKRSTPGEANESQNARAPCQTLNPSRLSLRRRDALQITRTKTNQSVRSKSTAKKSSRRTRDKFELDRVVGGGRNEASRASGLATSVPPTGAGLANGEDLGVENLEGEGAAAGVANDEGSVLSIGGASVSFESDFGADAEEPGSTTQQPFFDALFGQGGSCSSDQLCQQPSSLLVHQMVEPDESQPFFDVLFGAAALAEGSDDEAESICQQPFYGVQFGLDDNCSFAQAEHELLSLVPIPHTISFHDVYFGKEHVMEEERDSVDESEPVHFYGVYYGLDDNASVQSGLELSSLVLASPGPVLFHDVYFGKEHVVAEEEDEESDSNEPSSNAPKRIPRCTVQSQPLLVITLLFAMMARRVHAYFSSS
ncbi:hypothetical protein ACHAXT_012915 [Thalassiosira profunda]